MSTTWFRALMLLLCWGSAGCSSGLTSLWPGGAPGSHGGGEWRSSHLVMRPSCVVDSYGKDDGGFLGGLSFLGPIVMPALIDAGLSLISGGIRDIANMTRTDAVARTNGHFLRGDPATAQYRAHEDLGCIIFAYGRMNDSGGVSEDIGGVWGMNADEFAARGFNFAEAPLFYYEGIVRFSSETSTFSVSTTYLSVDEDLRRNRLFSRSSDDVVLTFTFQRQEGDTVAVGVIPFPNLARSVTLERDAAQTYATSWMIFPEPSDRDQLRLAAFCRESGCPVAAHTEGPQAECSHRGAICAQPFTLAVQLSVSSNASAAIEEIANQLDYARPAIAPRIEARLNDSLNLAQTTPEQIRLRSAAHSACMDLRASRAAFEAGDETVRSAMSGDVRQKINAAQEAYEAAGLEWWNVVADSALSCVMTR